MPLWLCDIIRCWNEIRRFEKVKSLHKELE